MKKKSDCGCSCKMAETFKDIDERLKKLEYYNYLREPKRDKVKYNPFSSNYKYTEKDSFVYPATDSPVGYRIIPNLSQEEFICQDCGKKGRGMGEFSYSTGYCDECYDARHSTYSHLNPLNPQRRIGRKK